MPTKQKPFTKILIANRGEIAVRAIRTCREMDIKVSVIYARADAHSLAVRLADEAYFVESTTEHGAYLDQEQITELALVHKCQAIYPGYGFLAENSDFAKLCENKGIVFIGPHSQALAQLGDKVEAKRLAKEVGIPLVPGEAKEIKKASEAKTIAAQIGYPIVIKASGGGGGRGIKIVDDEKLLSKKLSQASKEAKMAFSNPSVYIEKY
ncbi:MAG TPA: ATP-grasp domain-containing protein, partial [Candidatus Wirthbacteria bacterium]|nr:ATP-grasp domain-containing protein [Candidatus Wirthbacteria bacterium]